MANKISQKLMFVTISASLSLGLVSNTTAKAASAALITQKFNGNLTLEDSYSPLGPQPPQTTKYSGFITYSEPTNGSSCAEGICVPIEIENWSFKLNGRELNSPLNLGGISDFYLDGISNFSGGVAFESTSSSTPLSWSLRWLSDPTGDSGNYIVNWQQDKGIDLINSYFRGYYSYHDSNPQISYSPKSVPEPAGTAGLLGGLAVLSLARWTRKSILRPR